MPQGSGPSPGVTDELLADLTPAQQQAVTHFEGPLLILAGAGSGKTRVITRRVAWLLRQGVRPWNILAITFTNKAAGEMRQRVEALVPNSRVWVSTFHSLGARLLRLYAERVNLGKNFTIYDEQDRAKVAKQALEAIGMDNVRFTPDRIAGAISKAKNQLLTPQQYEQRASDYLSQTVARVYYEYEKRLRAQNALDFDDLLLIPALALKHDEELRSELDNRFRFVLIDEYQDTNQAQYEMARRLSIEQPNLCVVGDPDQCFPPGTLVQTPAGPRPIESFETGDEVISAGGWGRAVAMPVEKLMANPYRGRLVKVSLDDGTEVRATPNHICFARLRPNPAVHFVYLMWRRGVGYRLGTTRGVRASKDGVIMSGLQVRTNQEVADAVWIIRTCETSAEARFFEHYYSVKYGIPTMVFFVRGRRMDMTQDWIDRLFREVETEGAAQRLLTDLYLDRRFPHHRPAAVVRGELARRQVHFIMFGDNRPHTLRPWHEHRVQLVTSGEALKVQAASRFRVRSGERGTWRIETSRKNYEAGLELAHAIGQLDDFDVVSRARLTSGKAFPFMPASHLRPGMVVPVLVGERICERTVESIAWEDYEGLVYDLSVANTRNYVARALVVHNSIYKWRGSDIKNILDFERDFPTARVITLERNYRSTKAILAAADSLIAHNKQRKPKTLVTENPYGQPVRDLTFDTGLDEAEQVVLRIKRAHQQDGRPYRDFAIFLRINALSRALETAFVRHGVPFQIVRGLAFFERKENRDILAYLRLLVNPQDDLSFLRIVNEPPRGVGDVSLRYLRDYAQPREMPLLSACADVTKIPQMRGKAVNGLRDFSMMMQELRAHLEDPPEDFIRLVLEKTGYRAMLKTSGSEEDEERLANIEEFITAARQFAAEDPTRTIADFLEQVALAADTDSWDERQDCVSVMTLHAAKGLEFPVVYMLAVEQGLLPHERSLAKEEDVEEERRLCFVGMTRAKEELYLCHARLREFRGQALYAVPSMFLDELPREDGVESHDLCHHSGGAPADQWRGGHTAAEDGWHDAGYQPRPATPPKPDENGYAAGVIVEHGMYGRGQITSVSGEGFMRRIKIRFAKHGEKTFVADKVKLTVIVEE
jgi:DNA helicase-2/ATP-dependent DNA helicase PcrA